MTWVFGSPTELGSSVCVADIQVTVGEETFDCLRKVYGLDRNLMASSEVHVARRGDHRRKPSTPTI